MQRDPTRKTCLFSRRGRSRKTFTVSHKGCLRRTATRAAKSVQCAFQSALIFNNYDLRVSQFIPQVLPFFHALIHDRFEAICNVWPIRIYTFMVHVFQPHREWSMKRRLRVRESPPNGLPPNTRRPTTKPSMAQRRPYNPITP